MAAKQKKVVKAIKTLSIVEFETSEDVEIHSSFNDMNLREDVIRGIYSYGKRANLYDSCILPRHL